MTHAMYFGPAEKDKYSNIIANTTGSNNINMKESVFQCLERIMSNHQEDLILSVADFGTGDGVHFISLLEEIRRQIKQKNHNSMQLTAFFNDLPDNDFNLLHRNLSMLENEEGIKDELFCAVISKNMFNQCLQSNSLDLALSSSAVHWLSKIPCTIKDGLTWVHGDEQERELFAKQASKDWKNFLLARGKELNHGGFLVVLVSTCREDESSRSLYNQVSEAWRKMYASQKINKIEFENTTLGFYRDRSEADLRLPFEDPDIQQIGLTIVSIKPRLHKLSPLKKIQETSDKSAYALAVVSLTRPWLTNVIFHGLSTDREVCERNTIVEEYFHLLHDMLVENDLQFENFFRLEVVAKKLSQRQY